MVHIPASIRCKNPGAMWGKGNPIAVRWHSTGTEVLDDGLGQGNNIAVFANYVDGICAQLDLWRSSAKYKDKRFADAINVWDGHNNTESYIAYVLARVPGMTRDTLMDDAFWRGPLAIGFLKAQAGHEAGERYPAPDGDWLEAQKRVMTGVVSTPAPAPSPAPVKVPKKAVVVAGSATAAGAAAHAAGATHTMVAAIVIGVVVVSIIGLIIHNKAGT